MTWIASIGSTRSRNRIGLPTVGDAGGTICASTCSVYRTARRSSGSNTGMGIYISSRILYFEKVCRTSIGSPAKIFEVCALPSRSSIKTIGGRMERNGIARTIYGDAYRITGWTRGGNARNSWGRQIGT